MSRCHPRIKKPLLLLAAGEAETAHGKTIGMCAGSHAVANLVSSDTPAVLSLASNC